MTIFFSFLDQRWFPWSGGCSTQSSGGKFICICECVMVISLFWILSCFLSWTLQCLFNLCEGQAKSMCACVCIPVLSASVRKCYSHTSNGLLWSNNKLLVRNGPTGCLEYKQRWLSKGGGLLSRPMENATLVKFKRSHSLARKTEDYWDNSFENNCMQNQCVLLGGVYSLHFMCVDRTWNLNKQLILTLHIRAVLSDWMSLSEFLSHV